VSSRGTDVERLTSTSGRIDEIAASPDGSKIAYDAETYGYGKDLHVTGDDVHVMNADGSDNRVVYSCPSSTCSSLEWSPVGDRLLINGDAVLAPDGHVTALCDGGCASGYPLTNASWSPDGTRLVFEDSVTLHLQGGTSTLSAIGTANADGTNIQLLTNRKCATSSQSQCTYDTSPVWSPNGAEIAFVRLHPNFLRLDQSLGPSPTGPTGVFMVRPDGTAITEVNLCGNTCDISSIQWAPTGDRFAFVSTPNSLIGDATTSTVAIADPSTRAIDVIHVRTQTSQPDIGWLIPVVSWAPNGKELTMTAHQPGQPTGLYLVPIHHGALGSPVLIGRNAYSPLTWLPAAG
jgi:Tol biopolymer transport system component